MKSEDDIDLNKLFSPDVQYQVPLYQRRYVWDMSNWVALLRDILARLYLEPIEEKDPKDPKFLVRYCEKSTENVSHAIYKDKHFTGVIVTDPIQDTESLERFEVIDGQQRLTTFQIILCVIRDIFQSNKFFTQADDADALIVNKRAVAKRYSKANYKFVLTKFDKKQFEAVAGGDYGVLIPDAFDKELYRLNTGRLSQIRSFFPDPDVPNVNVFEAYNYFYEWIWIYMERDFDYTKLDDLLRIIKTQFTVVKIQLDPTDKSEKIFESINATGRKLSEFDYLRNNLFLRSKSLGKNEERKESYRDIFYRKYWHFENKRSYWNPERLEDFLRTVLIAKLGPSCFESTQTDEIVKQNNKAFEVYQDQYIKNIKKLEDKDIIEKLEDKDIIEKLEDKDIESELDELDEDIKRKYIELKLEIRELEGYSEDYKNAIPDPKGESIEYTEIGILMQFYRDLKIQSILPFVLHLKNEKGISVNEIGLVCKILESRIMRRLLFHPTGLDNEDKKVYDQVKTFFTHLVESRKFAIQQFANCLFVSNWPDSRGGKEWPDDEVLMRFGLRNIKDRFNTKDLRGILNEVCEQGILSNQHRAMLVLSYTFYRIEKHIDKNNKENLHFEDFLSYEPIRIQSNSQLSEYNTIGNFTFIEKDLVEGKSYNESNLKLNQELFELKKNNYESDLKAIRERTEILFNYFRQIWPDHESIIQEIRRNREQEKNKDGVSNGS